MIHALTPYPAMKDSGVPWLGQVPEHWDVKPALAVYKPREIKNKGMIENTVLSLSYGRIVIKPEEKLRGLVPESFETYQIVEPGNIIVRTTDLQNDKNSLRIGHARDRGIITSAYMCLETTDRVLNEFGYQYLNAYDLLKIIYGYGSGLRQNLDFKDIRRMPVLVPPPDEQAAIVRYLDHADRRIRRTIAAKQRLIKLLQEQKQVIIHQAVTRGLDPGVKLKPSGVEWLGDVPEEWEVKKLSHLFKYLKGRNSAKITSEYIGYNPGEYPVYSGQTGNGGLMGRIDSFEFIFLDPVIFITTVGAKAMTTRLVSGQFSLSQNCALMVPRTDSRMDYFEPVLQRAMAGLKASISLVMQPSLRFSDLNKLYVPVPSLDLLRKSSVKLYA